MPPDIRKGGLTQGGPYSTELTSSPDSLYLSVEKEVGKAANGEGTKSASMNRHAFAAGVVSNAMKTKSKLWYWVGGNTLLVWFVTTFFPHTFSVSAFFLSVGQNRAANLVTRIPSSTNPAD